MNPGCSSEGYFAMAALEEFVASILQRKDMPSDDARCVAASLVRSEARGWKTHGLSRVKSYVDMLDEGLFNPVPAMHHTVLRGGVVFDADGAMGAVAARDILRAARHALRDSASVLVVARDVGHLGALGVHVLAAAESGLFCMAGQQTPRLLALEGFERRAIGNNPLAFGCPLPDAPPLVFDMACSKAARGHILLAAREGRSIPPGWAVDDEGASTTDASRALHGALLPAGDAKGLGLAMMVQVLAASLSATDASNARAAPSLREGGGTSRVGAFFWFVDPDAFGSRAAFDESMSDWTGYFIGSSTRGAARLPGQRGATLEEQARKHGIALSAPVQDDLTALAQRFELPFVAPRRA
ncbi:(2R)-3-sulfolactate dehydrogenase (NADP(+)) (plasmid) [Variovorax sp. SRS16]|nr:(2R)-3-sulfolactate dehydrogenase (NADP(+)) [Variovorax sp. SRS16]